MINVTENLASWAAVWPETSLSDTARSRAKEALQDTVACMVAGAAAPESVAARTAVKGWAGNGTATVVGSETGAPVPFAAFVNATASHALDYDDTVWHAFTHTSAVMFPALLALAEQRNLTVDQILTAWIVGLEVQVTLGRAVNRDHYDTGWHATSTLGLIGATAACGRLLSLTEGQMVSALSLSTSMAAGTKSQFGTMAKPMHAGLAAKGAVFAAVMAENSTSAATNALEGEYGFLSMYCAKGWRDFGPLLENMGAPLAIEWLGLETKVYPCCSSMHLALDAVADMQDEHAFTFDLVENVSATIAHGPSLALIHRLPENEAEARFSFEYSAAALLLSGRLNLADYAPEGFERPNVRRLMKKVVLQTWGPESPRGDSVVSVTLQDGTILTGSNGRARGSLARPMSEDDRRAKFEDCTSGMLPTESSTALACALSGATAQTSVRSLMRWLRFDACREANHLNSVDRPAAKG